MDRGAFLDLQQNDDKFWGRIFLKSNDFIQLLRFIGKKSSKKIKMQSSSEGKLCFSKPLFEKKDANDGLNGYPF